MPVSEKVKRAVWVKSGGTCAVCRARLMAEYISGAETHFLGEVAHIVAEQSDGPRGNAKVSLTARNSENNLLLLCFNCHKMIDDDTKYFSSTKLQQVKTTHEQWVMAKYQAEEPKPFDFHNLYYINVPRLNLLAASAGMSIDVEEFNGAVSLHSLGMNLNRLMSGFKSLLSQVEIRSIDVETALTSDIDARGMIIRFDRDFRTKNVRMPNSAEEYGTAVTGDINKDPHIYCRVAGLKILLKIDPRWITTTTSFFEFRRPGGKNKFAGLGIINSVDKTQRIVSVTPYVIGLPSSPFLKDFYENMLSYQNLRVVNE